MASGPVLAERSYQVQVQALAELQRLGIPVLQGTPPFIGMTAAEVVKALEHARDELDWCSTLAVIAASEAVFRVDMKWRIVRGKKAHPIVSSLRTLKKAKKSKVRLDDVFDAWRSAAGTGTGAFGKLKQLYVHRHWLAHGRYWPDRSGVAPDAAAALKVYQDVEKIVKTVARDFPRAPR